MGLGSCVLDEKHEIQTLLGHLSREEHKSLNLHPSRRDKPSEWKGGSWRPCHKLHRREFHQSNNRLRRAKLGPRHGGGWMSPGQGESRRPAISRRRERSGGRNEWRERDCPERKGRDGKGMMEKAAKEDEEGKKRIVLASTSLLTVGARSIEISVSSERKQPPLIPQPSYCNRTVGTFCSDPSSFSPPSTIPTIEMSFSLSARCLGYSCAAHGNKI